MKAMLLSVLKWWLIIVFAGVAIYLVIPKWMPAKNPRIVVNQFTGEVRKVKFQKPKPETCLWKDLKDLLSWQREPESWTKVTNNTKKKTDNRVTYEMVFFDPFEEEE